jgi:uncharacterized protein YjbI with pentapeptide repeats
MQMFLCANRKPEKTTASFFFVVVFAVLLITGCASPPEAISNDRSALELEKLRLEVTKLEQEQQLFTGSRILSFAGSILGSIAILWTIGQGYQTLRNQTSNQKQSHLAEILTALSSENEMTRMGAARSLSRYPDETLDEILSALRFENSPRVRDVLEDTLEKTSPKNFVRILRANTKTLEQRINLLGCLNSLRARKEYSIALLRLSDHATKVLLGNNNYRFQYDHGVMSQRHEQKILEDLEEPLYKNNGHVLQKCEQATNLALSTSKVISRLLRAGYKMGTGPINLDLTASNLYRVDLQKVQLPNSIFTRSIMRHVDLSHGYLPYSDFAACNLYASTLNYADLSHCCLSGAILLDLQAEATNFQYADLTDTSFSRGNLDHADFRHCTGTKINMNGIDSKEILFDDCDLELLHFEGTTLVHCSFRNAHLYKSKFNASKIIDSDLQGVRLNGADLTGTKFRGSDCLDADLSGANVRKADFRGAKNVATAKFYGTKNLETALFDPGVEIQNWK